MKKCMIFKDIFPGLSRTKVIIQDFPGPGIFKKKNPGLFRRCGADNEFIIDLCEYDFVIIFSDYVQVSVILFDFPHHSHDFPL